MAKAKTVLPATLDEPLAHHRDYIMNLLKEEKFAVEVNMFGNLEVDIGNESITTDSDFRKVTIDFCKDASGHCANDGTKWIQIYSHNSMCKVGHLMTDGMNSMNSIDFHLDDLSNPKAYQWLIALLKNMVNIELICRDSTMEYKLQSSTK